MRARLLPLLAVTALAAGVGVVIWHSMKPSPLPAEPPTVAAKPAESTVPPEAPKVEAASAPAPVTPKRVSDADAKSGKHWWDGFVPGKKARIETAKVEKAEEAKIAIDGVVVVVDSNGTEHREESGTLRPLFAWPSDDSTSADDSPLRRGKRAGFRRGGSIGDAVPVEQGRFHAEVPPGRDFSAQTVTVGGRTAVVDSEPVKVGAGQVVTIRAHWIDGVRVHVVDKESRAELDDVAVVRSLSSPSWSDEGDPGDPDERETVVEHGRSPVVVPPREQKFGFGLEMTGRVWVRARGHAWRALEIEYADLADRTVELEGAAELVVDVQGELPEPRPAVDRDDHQWGVLSPEGTVARDDRDRAPMLRLRKPVEKKSFDDVIEEALGRYDDAKPSDFPGGKKPTLAEFKRLLESMRDQFEASQSAGELLAERRARPGETRFEAIAAREVVVSVEVGESYRTPLVLGSARAKLAAGSSTSVAVVVAKVETPTAVRLAGTIRVPSGWELGKLSLVIEPIDLKGRSDSDRKRLRSNEWTRTSGGGLYRWDAGSVLPARYAFKVNGAGIAKLAVVPPTGNENVEIVVPEAATLAVRVVDAANGDAVKMESLHFMPSPEDVAFFDFESIDLEYDSKRGSYSARVPVGAGRLVSWNDDWMFVDESAVVDVHAGDQEVVARVSRRCGVVFELACAGTKVEWSDHQGFEVRIVSADGKGRMDWMSERDSKPMMAVTAPGRYTVTVPAIAGYEPVAPFEIEIPAGEFVTRTIELKKAR